MSNSTANKNQKAMYNTSKIYSDTQFKKQLKRNTCDFEGF